MQDMEERPKEDTTSQSPVADVPDFFKVQERTYKERRER